MINREKTLQIYGYDIDLSKKSRRSAKEHSSTNGVLNYLLALQAT